MMVSQTKIEGSRRLTGALVGNVKRVVETAGFSATMAMTAVMFVAPAQAQLIGETPQVLFTNAASTALTLGGAVGGLAGMVQGVNVWMGTHDLWRAVKWFIGGAALFFGVPALVGFGGGGAG